MTIDLKTIKHISKLSRISVDNVKANKLAGDLNSIFDFIEKLNELNTDNVEPLSNVSMSVLPLREDNALQSDLSKDVLSNAPEKLENYFVVPKVVE